MSAIRAYLVGFFTSLYFAITERSIKAGLELWRGWKETQKFVHKDDRIFDTERERDDKIFKNVLNSLNELERKITQGQRYLVNDLS